MVQYGYARVSSISQTNNYSLSNQENQLIASGILKQNIISEVGSASTFDRPKLNNLLDQAVDGDSIHIVRVDRFARCTVEAMTVIQKLQKKM